MFDFATPWTVAHQASLSFTISQTLLKLISIELVMPFDLPILCSPLPLFPLIFLSISVLSSELALHIRWPKDWSFIFRVPGTKMLCHRRALRRLALL